MLKKSFLGLLLFLLVVPAGATKISNVKVDFVKCYRAIVENNVDTRYYMGRLTYTFLAEGKDSVNVDFNIVGQTSGDTAPVFEKTGDIGLVRQINASDTSKIVFFRVKFTGNQPTSNYIANITANANMSQMWKLADSLVKLMTLQQRQGMLYVTTAPGPLQYFGSENFNLQNGTTIVGWRCSDGPHGVRYPLGPNGTGIMEIAIYGMGDTVTSFPCESATGCTWDTSLTRRIGQAIGQESRAKGVYCNLGPMCDLVVNPRWGRAFETMGEDPYLNGRMVASQVKGLQSEKVIATPKHFVPYMKEDSREGMTVVVSERTLRELFCVPFEYAIKEGKARAIMTAYNKTIVPGFTTSNATELAFGAQYSGTNHHLINDILRNDWGFDGVIMTDWNGAMYTTDESYVFNTSFDMSMPWGAGLTNSAANVNAGIWNVDTLNKKAKNCMYDRLWAWGGHLLTSDNDIKTYPKSNVLNDDHKAIALEAARKSIVLAKNNLVNGLPILPLNKNATFKLAVVGPFADVPRPGGGGSSAVTPDSMRSPLQSIRKLLASYPNVTVTTDYTTADVAIVCVGTSGESESTDRISMVLPVVGSTSINQNDLVQQVMSKVPKTIVLYTGGSASVAGSWSAAPAILIAFYGGRSQGQAIAEALFGDVNPGGHLNVTFPKTINDLPSYELNSNYTITLPSADTAHGYFYFEKTQKTPLFWFGHGLSYTTFSLNAIGIRGDISSISAGDQFDVVVPVKNTGAIAGDEVVQLYIKPPTNGTIPRRIKDLRGFSRVSLQSGETKAVTFTLGPRDFSVYNVNATTKTGQWLVVPGTYTIIAGTTSDPAELAAGNGKSVFTTITIQ
jgi:beta-glucosidase